MVNNRVCSYDILKSISAGLCLLDRNFRILWVNRHQAQWFGASKDICGKHCYAMFEHRSHICRGCPTLKVFRNGQPHTAKRIGTTKEGKKRYYNLTVSPIKNNQGKIEFALELVQDITEKVLEEKRNLKIMRRLKHMYQRLSAVNNKLRSNMHRLKGIAAHMAIFKDSLNKKYHRAVNEIEVIKEELEDVFRVARSLAAGIDLNKISSMIARLTCELTHAEACTLRLLDESGNTLIVNSSHGLSDRLKKSMPALKVGESVCGKAASIKKAVVVYDINSDRRVKNPQLIIKEGYKSIVCVPIVFQGKALGVISAFSKKTRHFGQDIVSILEIFASQAATAVQESRHYQDIHKNYFDTVHALVLAEEARDPYTRGHTDRVTKYAISLARAMRLSASELEVLRYAGEVHDIGKISIPDFILGKPGKLTPAERAMIELHPAKGAEMLESLEFLRPALPVVRHHHERYDGTGYPDGLGKEKIPLMARILACADAFDAMTSDRPYRNRKLTVEEALSEIKNNSGSQFDPHIAHSFIHFIRSQK